MLYLSGCYGVAPEEPLHLISLVGLPVCTELGRAGILSSVQGGPRRKGRVWLVLISPHQGSHLLNQGVTWRTIEPGNFFCPCASPIPTPCATSFPPYPRPTTHTHPSFLGVRKKMQTGLVFWFLNLLSRFSHFSGNLSNTESFLSPLFLTMEE